MSARYSLTQGAQEDLAEILDRITAESGLIRAESVHGRIERAFELLAERPGIGHLRIDLTKNPRVRIWSVFSYLIVFLPVIGRPESVVVLRILHGAQDPDVLRRKSGS